MPPIKLAVIIEDESGNVTIIKGTLIELSTSNYLEYERGDTRSKYELSFFAEEIEGLTKEYIENIKKKKD